MGSIDETGTPRRSISLSVRYPGARCSSRSERREPGAPGLLRRREIARIDRFAALFDLEPMDHVLAKRRWTCDTFQWLFTVFGGAALSAAVGIYGLVSATTRARIPELGIRQRSAPTRAVSAGWCFRRACPSRSWRGSGSRSGSESGKISKTLLFDVPTWILSLRKRSAAPAAAGSGVPGAGRSPQSSIPTQPSDRSRSNGSDASLLRSSQLRHAQNQRRPPPLPRRGINGSRSSWRTPGAPCGRRRTRRVVDPKGELDPENTPWRRRGGSSRRRRASRWTGTSCLSTSEAAGGEDGACLGRRGGVRSGGGAEQPVHDGVAAEVRAR